MSASAFVSGQSKHWCKPEVVLPLAVWAAWPRVLPCNIRGRETEFRDELSFEFDRLLSSGGKYSLALNFVIIHFSALIQFFCSHPGGSESKLRCGTAVTYVGVIEDVEIDVTC